MLRLKLLLTFTLLLLGQKQAAEPQSSRSSRGGPEKVTEELQSRVATLEKEIGYLNRISELEAEVQVLRKQLAECELPSDPSFQAASTGASSEISSHTAIFSIVNAAVSDLTSALLPMILGILAYVSATNGFARDEKLKKAHHSCKEGGAAFAVQALGTSSGPKQEKQKGDSPLALATSKECEAPMPLQRAKDGPSVDDDDRDDAKEAPEGPLALAMRPSLAQECRMQDNVEAPPGLPPGLPPPFRPPPGLTRVEPRPVFQLQMPGLVDLSEATVHYEEQAEQPEEPSGEVTEEAAPKEETLEEVDQTEQINLKALNVEEEGADNSRTLEDGQQEEEAEVEVEEDEEGEIEERSDHEEVEEVAEQEEEEEEDEHFDENEEQAVNDDHKKTGGKVHRRPKKKNSTNSTSEGKEKGRRAKQKKVERDTSNSKASKVEVNKGSQEAETRVGRSHIIVAALALAVLAGLGLKVLRRKTVVSSSFFVEPLPEHCTREIPEHVKIFSADKKLPMKVMETKPSIALHAPCFLKSFQKVSRKYRPTGNWYWQKTDADSGERLSIQHQHEPAISSTRIRDDSAVVTFLTDHIFPKFGELNELSYDWYVLQQDAGFVVLLPDPAAHQSVFEAQSHWRPLFQKLAHTFYPKYFMAYASTFDAKSRKWIEKDFGITSFPAVVIFTGHPADQPQIVEQNALEMTYENLAQFIQDVEDGCLTWVHPLLTFNDLKPFTEKEMPTCPLKS